MTGAPRGVGLPWEAVLAQLWVTESLLCWQLAQPWQGVLVPVCASQGSFAASTTHRHSSCSQHLEVLTDC